MSCVSPFGTASQRPKEISSGLDTLDNTAARCGVDARHFVSNRKSNGSISQK
jgi:hypothetical protein